MVNWSDSTRKLSLASCCFSWFNLRQIRALAASNCAWEIANEFSVAEIVTVGQRACGSQTSPATAPKVTFFISIS